MKCHTSITSTEIHLHRIDQQGNAFTKKSDLEITFTKIMLCQLVVWQRNMLMKKSHLDITDAAVVHCQLSLRKNTFMKKYPLEITYTKGVLYQIFLKRNTHKVFRISRGICSQIVSAAESQDIWIPILKFRISRRICSQIVSAAESQDIWIPKFRISRGICSQIVSAAEPQDIRIPKFQANVSRPSLTFDQIRGKQDPQNQFTCMFNVCRATREFLVRILNWVALQIIAVRKPSRVDLPTLICKTADMVLQLFRVTRDLFLPPQNLKLFQSIKVLLKNITTHRNLIKVAQPTLG